MADTLDILTLSEGHSAINLADSNTAYDTELAMFITGISRRIDRACGPVVARATTERFDGGDSIVELRTFPIVSVTSVTEWLSDGTSVSLTAETDNTKPAEGYLLINEKFYVAIVRREAGLSANFEAGTRNIIVVTSAGRAASTAAVDPLFKLAAANILRRTWKRESPSWAQTPGFGDDQGLDFGFFRAVDPMIHEWLSDEIGPAIY